MAMNNVALIVIDPLFGFCEPSGSLAQKYGRDELGEIQRTIPRIRKAVEESKKSHLVISEYARGKFTEGNFTDKLANLCVPAVNEDCKVIKELADIEFDSVSMKYEQNALSSDAFVEVIRQDIESGVRVFVIAGFLIEHCIRTTAIELKRYVSDRNTRVVVCSNLSSSRVDKYRSGEVENTLGQLKQIGVEIESWENLAITSNLKTDAYGAV